MTVNNPIKYNAKYKTLYVNQGSAIEFEGSYKLDKTKVIFTGKLLSSENDVIDKDSGHTITLPIPEVITFELFTENTKVMIKDKEYTFRTFDSFLLLFAHLNYLDIGEDDPFKGYLDFGLNPNYLEILGNGVDDFGKPVSKDEIHTLIASKCHIQKLENLSFDLPANQSKSFQKGSFNEYQRLSDRYKFLCEKLGLDSNEANLSSLFQCIDQLIESYGDTLDVNQLLAILISK
jgi:hypothetical protein